MELIGKSAGETQKIAGTLAKEILGWKTNKAKVIALEGNLGAGKTTFAQGFARALGVRENVLSPTFVIMKIYEFKLKTKNYKLKTKFLVHIDCYRLDSPKDLLRLGFKELLKDKDAIILTEWADRVREIIPKSAIWIVLKHGKKVNERLLKIKMENAKIKMTKRSSENSFS